MIISILSKKKTAALYNIIHEEIMQARVKLSQLMENNHLKNEVDEIMYKLQQKCPDNATKLFEKEVKP